MKRHSTATNLVLFALTLGCGAAVRADGFGVVPIPAGTFIRGDVADQNAAGDAPTNSVYVGKFFMDTNLVSLSRWQTVYNWATTNGYQFGRTGSASGSDNPVAYVSWSDAALWCNARSEMESNSGNTVVPCYYTDISLKQVWRSGSVALGTNNVNWSANGYRLPTEAEWEKAARGGLVGQRFPWGAMINHSNACYTTETAKPSYDSGAIVAPATTAPVGSFPTNNFGVFDMAGNVEEWCWDWYSSSYYTSSSSTSNPVGPATGVDRVLRGGGYSLLADSCRVAFRTLGVPTAAYSFIGFRTVRVNNLETPTVTVAVGDYVYTGSAQGPSLSDVNAGGSPAPIALAYSGTDFSGATYGASAVAPTNAGSYSLVVTVAATNSFGTGFTNVSFTIGQATPSVIAANRSVIYNGQPARGAGSATGGAGESLPVTLSYTGTGATAYGPTTVAPTDAGIYTFTVATAGDINNSPGASSATLTISNAVVTVMANSDNKTYGQTRSYGAGSAAFTSIGLQNGETIGSVTITANGGTAANAPVGSYSLIPNAATGGTFNPANYSINYSNAALMVNPATLSITANSLNKTYGQTVTFTGMEFTHTALVNGDTVASVTLNSAGATNTATVASSAYSITVTNAEGSSGLTNYLITYLPGSLTVNPAVLIIAANGDHKIYGQTKSYGANSTAFTTSGLTNSDVVNSVTLASTGATNTATVAGSPYSITVTNAEGNGLGNYQMYYAPGVLVVAPTNLIITANDATIGYSAANPTFTANYSSFANGETSNVLGGVLTVWSPATPGFLPGVYTNLIIPSLSNATNENYNISYGYGTLTIVNSSGTTGVANGDGSLNLMVLTNLLGNTTVSQEDLSAVLAHYWTNQPPVMSAFTAGKTNFTFSLTNFNFAVQVSHDLLDWTNLGVSAEFEFTDTNASPNAYYRLITP